MKFSISLEGLFNNCKTEMGDDATGLGSELDQLHKNLLSLSRRSSSGDLLAVDEFFEIYPMDSDLVTAREGVSTSIRERLVGFVGEILRDLPASYRDIFPGTPIAGSLENLDRMAKDMPIEDAVEALVSGSDNERSDLIMSKFGSFIMSIATDLDFVQGIAKTSSLVTSIETSPAEAIVTYRRWPLEAIADALDVAAPGERAAVISALMALDAEDEDDGVQPMGLSSDTLAFTPCSVNCPAITGKPYGSARFCPMNEMSRHKSVPSDRLPEWRPIEGTSRWEGRDGSTGEWIEGDPEKTLLFHPDYTDCCANFQCCLDEADEQGHGELLRSLVQSQKMAVPDGVDFDDLDDGEHVAVGQSKSPNS